jgi:hypothetical protein
MGKNEPWILIAVGRTQGGHPRSVMTPPIFQCTKANQLMNHPVPVQTFRDLETCL